MQAEGKWWVVEGFEITPYTPTPGTALIPFTDAKRMLMQLPPEEAEFIPEEKGKKDITLKAQTRTKKYLEIVASYEAKKEEATKKKKSY